MLTLKGPGMMHLGHILCIMDIRLGISSSMLGFPFQTGLVTHYPES